MSTRVLSTEEGKAAIGRLQQIITGDLTSQVKAVQEQGTILSNPSVWDGQLAEQFRGTWDQMKSTLDQTVSALEELRAQVDRINVNIMTAGGNA